MNAPGHRAEEGEPPRPGRPSPAKGDEHGTAQEPRPPQAADGPHDHRDHHRHLGARRLRGAGHQDRRPRRGRARLLRERVIVSSAAGGGGMFPLPISLVARAAAVDGVDVAYGQIETMIDHLGHQIGLADEMIGYVPGSDAGRDDFPYRYASGRPLTAGDEGTNVVVLGSDLARKNGVRVGGTIRIREADFAVVGILEPTLTLPDSQAFMPLEVAQIL